MRGMPFLPEELGRAKKQTRAQLPANHVGPLVDQQWEIPVRLDPVLVCMPDDRRRSGGRYP
jgi:hypothetical protein